MRSEVQALLCVVILQCVLPVSCSGYGHFYGGSLSYVLEDAPNDRKLVKISLITGWVLGKGPCWTGCSKTDIGRSTLTTRTQAIAADSKYLGAFDADYSLAGSTENKIYPMEDLHTSPIAERVIDVSEHAKYEQEIQTWSFIMPNDTGSLDMNFEGYSWRNLTLQGGSNLKWHFQTHISVLLRNDTNSTNHCPQTLARPFYRVKLDQTASIRIATMDPDGDFVKCNQAEWVEGGAISSHLPPHVTIHENCIVTVDATVANGFLDDTWIAIAVSIADYNRNPITYGPDELPNSQYLLSTTTLQFVVQVLANLTTPEFVEPTLEGNHVFIMYADTTWRTEIHAMAPENTTIQSFTAFGVKQEDFKFSALQDDPRRELVRHATMLWQPSEGEIGRHIACVQAVDNTDVESAEQRCYVLHVQADTFNHTTTITPGKPYFVDIPSPDQLVNCDMKATCVVPLYVKCDKEVVDIHVKDSFIEEYHIGPIEVVQHKGETLYKADLFFSHSIHGQEKLCLSAKDKSGTESETVCITSDIEPPNPCISAPCQNSGVCLADKTTGGYQCRCTDKYSGRNCQTKYDICRPVNPCGPNGYCVNKPAYLCYCKPGFTGKYCETNINDCRPDSCNHHGTCIDAVKSVKCECFGRYTGDKCTNDTCDTEDPSLLTCPAAGCSSNSCNRNGVCTAGGNCTCSSGYKGASCDTGVCDISATVTGVQILSPSIKDGGRLTCYVDDGNILPCHLRVYLATASGSPPSVSIKTSLASGGASVTSVTPNNEFPGKTGVFSADLSLNGPVQTTKDNFVCISASSGTPSTTVCLELRLIQNPLKNPESLQSTQANATLKFVEPSLKDHSRIICYVGKPCTVQLYTSFKTNKTCNVPGASGSSGSVGSCGGRDLDNDVGLGYTCCEDVISSTTGVTVFPVHARGQSCVTEASISITGPGEKDICFQSGQIGFQQVCYTVGVYAPNTDPCQNANCQNGGHCFHDGHDGFRCVCPENYVGAHCETGPCQPSDNICTNGAYCQVDNGTETCICEAGYGDQDCSKVSATTQQTVGYATFTDTAKPLEYTCVLHQICSLELIVSGITGQTPDVSKGYLSPSLGLDDITVTSRPSIQDSYLAAIRLKTSELGLQNACIQTKDATGVNRDEICFVLHVISDVQSLYGFKDRPHFVDPSLLTDTEVVCSAGKPCHIMYHVTTGVGNENQCLDYESNVSDDFVNYHIFSSCDNSVPGGSGDGRCTLDVSVSNAVADIGSHRTFCVELGMKASNVTGEQRCFKVKVESQAEANVKVGCQVLHCVNGGFCDGLNPSSPICYCPSGYSGNTCDKAQLQTSFTGSQSLISDFSLPSEINCQIGKTCAIPFKDLTKPGIAADVSLGYVDPLMIVDKLVLHTSPTIPTEHKGYVTASSKQEGTYTACLQATTIGKVEDEQCVKVTFIDTGSNGDDVDETKPYFLVPTMPADSSVVCQVNKPCHLDMHYTNGDKFAAPGKCPNLVNTSPSVLPGLHLFDSIFHTNECTTDILYVAPAVAREKTMCLKLSLPGKKGERRCYKIKVVSDITKEVVSPCKGTTCANNGKCIGNPETSTTSGTCFCSNGFYGNTCTSAYNTAVNLPGVQNITTLPTGPLHFSTIGAIPEVVKCITGDPCCVHIPYFSTGNEKPMLGNVGTLTSFTSRVLTPDASTSHHVMVQCVTGELGNHQLCIQTSTNGTHQGVNIDEVCLTVDISASPATPPPKQEPRFSTGLDNGTVVVCTPSSTCHIPVVTSANASKCSQVHECGDGVPGIHVFDTTLLPTGRNCFTDVAIKTGSSGSVELCISAGKGGQETHLVVKTENKQEFGPCQKKHCRNGGKCKATSMTTAECVCQPGYTGALCETDTDECDPKPCQNNATCVDGINVFRCQCLPGFNGTHCEIDIDECLSLPCKNNATCVDGPNSYSCHCRSGFTGTDCSSNINDCSSNPCENSAKCIDGINSYTCNCQSGYSGTRCEITTTPSTTTSTSTAVPTTTSYIPSPGSRTHTGVATDNEQLPPAFIEYTIPEIIRCTVNKECSILLPVDGKPGMNPHVQHGHYDPGLNMQPVRVVARRGVPCDLTVTRCAYEATITVIPTEVKMYKYCVQTTDNHMINADELCYKIQGIPDNAVTNLPGFVYPPTLPENSTMSCPTAQTCHYQIEVKKRSGKCDLRLVQSQLIQEAVKISEFENLTSSCKYDIAVTIPTIDSGTKSYCFKASNGTTPTCLTVDIKNNASGKQETCTTLHCEHGGFCDSVNGAPSSCLCKPGFTGKRCEIGNSCGIPTPETIKCSINQQCEHSFIIQGSTPPTVSVDNGAVATTQTLNNEHVVTIIFKTATTNASKVCIKVDHGLCNDRKCMTVLYDPDKQASNLPGGFYSSELQYTCELPPSNCFVTTTTHPLANNKCPDIHVHKYTTVARYHVFDPLRDGGECKSTIAVTGSATEGEHQKLCLNTDAAAQQCIDIKITSTEAPCNKKAAREHARKMVDTGYASCSCEFNGKKLNIIKKRPTIEPEKLYKAAGFGAGGMVGTMIVGVVIYAVVSKIKSAPAKKEKPKPSPRMRPKVHPQRQKRQVRQPKISF